MQTNLRNAIEQNERISFGVEFPNTSRFRAKLRYWWCWLVAGSLVLFVATPLLILLRLIKRKTWLYPWCFWGARVWLNACDAKVHVTGTENLDANRAYIFISNHRSYLDTAALFAFLERRIGLVGKKELLRIPIFGYGLGFVNIIAIDRTNPERARQSMDRAREVVNDGYSFGVFAEGTRAMPGELLPFKKGAFHLALQTQAPIVPVAIRNTDWMMGKKSAVAFPGTIEMVLLQPIETRGLHADEDLMNLLKQVRAAIAQELLEVTDSRVN
jgi:1-acyl-sn-glycerol-3-phosphate acyltransferase